MRLGIVLQCVLSPGAIASTRSMLPQIETSIVSHFMDLVDVADKDKNGKIDFDEWEIMGRTSCKT